MIYPELISSARDKNVTLRSAVTCEIHTSLRIFYCLETFSNIPKQFGKQPQLYHSEIKFQYCALWAPMDCNQKLNSQIFLPSRLVMLSRRRSKAKIESLEMKIKHTWCTEIYLNLVLQGRTPDSGFLLGNFFQGGGGKIYRYANFFCYANFSIVFRTKLQGDESLWWGKLLQVAPSVAPASPPPPWKKARILGLTIDVLDMFKFSNVYKMKIYPKTRIEVTASGHCSFAKQTCTKKV